MYIIVGLGNPGSKYEGTRHNAGFETVDRLANEYGLALDFIKHEAMCAKGMIEGNKVILAKPTTYMNLSGKSVRQLVNFYKIKEEELIIIYDDISLAPGQLRIRKKGSAGGHNGIKSIIEQLGTDTFTRIKVGVGSKPAGWDLADFVLGHFQGNEVEIMKEAYKQAASAVVDIIKNGPDHAMNEFNSKK